MKKFRPDFRVQGFTLLEMVVAVSIFAIISTVSYTSLVRYFGQSQKIEAAHEQLEQIQKLFSLLERDIRFIVARPVRYNSTNYAAIEVYKNRPVFSGERMQFTTSRPTVLNAMVQINFRVSWRFNNHTIYRYSWQQLDLGDKVLADKDTQLQHIQQVATGVESFDVSVALHGQEEDDSYFNEQVFTNDFDENLYLLPALVKITVKTESGRNYFRVLGVGSAV